MKRSQSTPFNHYKRFKSSNGSNNIARDNLPTTSDNLISVSATATLSNAHNIQSLEFGVGVYLNPEEWIADENFGLPQYTSIWTPD